MLLSKALALAAVEVIEGRPRELARMRRRPGFAKDRPHISHREAVERTRQALEAGSWPEVPGGWEARRRRE
jgi:hypothetical protein